MTLCGMLAKSTQCGTRCGTFQLAIDVVYGDKCQFTKKCRNIQALADGGFAVHKICVVLSGTFRVVAS